MEGGGGFPCAQVYGRPPCCSERGSIPASQAGEDGGGRDPPPPPCAQVYGRPPRCSERESIPASQAGEDGGGVGGSHVRRCTAGPRVALSEDRYQRLRQGKMEGGEIPPPLHVRRCTAGPRVALSENRYQRLRQGKMEGGGGFPCAQVYGRPPCCSERGSIPASQPGEDGGGRDPPPPPCAQVYGRPPRCSERESIPASQPGEDGGGRDARVT